MNSDKVQVVLGDITHMQVDAIVNAANSTLLGGGGVDGAIHRAAGPDLLEECKKLGGCPKGEARLTGAYRLTATWVIHTVGPRWKGGADDEDRFLALCYKNSLLLADKCFCRTVAFPSISTGAYGFPVDRAARIAIREILRFPEEKSTIEKVHIVCFDRPTFDVYRAALREAA